MDIFNWTFKDDIIYEYADKECNRICHAAIKQLQALGTDYIGTLIDDQCCKNVWNILCVSMQDYPTSDMWLYESYGSDIIAKLITPLPEYIKMAIWWKYVLHSGDSHLDNTKIMIVSIRGKILSISKGSLIAKMKSSPTFGMNMSFQLLVITQIASFVGN